LKERLSEGRIIKGIGGFYYIQDKGGDIHECKARGRFRKDGITPLTGDRVLFSEGGFIEEIQQRKNELKRPRVTNIDIAVIVISAVKPKPDYLLCDRLLISIKLAGIKPLLVINKCDIAEKRHIKEIKNEYKSACRVLCVSAKTGARIKKLKALLNGSYTCFAGQSATGKTSIINALFPGLGLKVGSLSKKADRGKNTTRQAELIVADGFSGGVVDTPGFTCFEAAEIEPEMLSRFYNDFTAFIGRCRFTSCLHADEPGCSVKKAVEKGAIKKGRYERYLEILNEIKTKRSKKYD
jgi:ribosome biogenesis GTPase